MITLISELTGTYGPSGREENIREVIERKVAGKVDEIYTDTLGNLVAVKKGKGRRIMLAAHMDEIGLIATFIDEKGFIRYSNIGGASPFYSLGQKVRFKNGVTGCVFYEQKLEEFKELKHERMYIDIGTRSREETEKLVTPGDIAVFAGDAVEQNGRFISRALDDRIGCAILIKLLEDLEDTENEIICVFTVQEEVGSRGAGTAAYGLMPDIAVAIDVTNTGDTPECKPLSVDLGKGPAVMVKDAYTISHPLVKNALIECAEKMSIPYQLEVISRGGNDAGAIHKTAGGIPSGGVSIPCRYMHSPCEMVDKSDVENTVKLLKAFVSFKF
ncbi:MAG: M42 family metallopeptidase [Clostridiaceae bacterium]|jgi:putative aminopeptidase FrvX|nr:M42 family metallopeptidase [Clostridiaceae bacterium]